MSDLLGNINGVTDYYPQNMRNLEYIFEKFKKISELYCYNRYDTSILEKTDIYKIKTNNDDIYKELYTFESEGKNICLRPESTTSLVRLAKNMNNEPNMKLYNIGQYFRFEKNPNKYRKRCFYQWNVDIINCYETSSEIEILDMLLSFFVEINISNDIEIRISHRGAINYFLNTEMNIDINSDEVTKLYNIIDKINNVSREQTMIDLTNLKIMENKNIDIIFEFILEKNIDILIQKYDKNIHLVQLKNIIDTLSKLGMDMIKLDMTIVRGLNYYTGMVFEVFSKNKKINRAIAGGGRYDSIFTAFGQKARKCCGFAVGDVVLLELLKELKKLPDDNHIDYCIIPMNNTMYVDSLFMAKNIRAKNKSVCVYTNDSPYKLRSAYNYTDRMNASFAILVTENYCIDGLVSIKNMNLEEKDPNKNISVNFQEYLISI